jgi:hypothetical protein
LFSKAMNQGILHSRLIARYMVACALFSMR